MNRPLDHEQCSERLSAALQGTLPAGEAAAVRAHVAECPRCAAEERVLRELLAPVEPMSAAESQELRAAVLASVRSPVEVGAGPVAPRRRPGFQRAAPILAAAALIVGGIVFAGTNLLERTGGQDSAATGEAGSGPVQVADVSDELAFSRPTANRSQVSAVEAPGAVLEADSDVPVGDSAGDAVGGADGYEGSEKSSGTTAYSSKGNKRRAPEPPRPLFVRGAGRLTDRTLTLVGRYGLPMVLFPQAYTTVEATRLQQDYLVALSNAAETEAESQQVIECGAQVLSQERPVLPALATFGTFEGEPVFLLALAWTEAERGPLDRYMVWTWPAGRCDQVPAYRAGRIGV